MFSSASLLLWAHTGLLWESFLWENSGREIGWITCWITGKKCTEVGQSSWKENRVRKAFSLCNLMRSTPSKWTLPSRFWALSRFWSYWGYGVYILIVASYFRRRLHLVYTAQNVAVFFFFFSAAYCGISAIKCHHRFCIRLIWSSGRRERRQITENRHPLTCLPPDLNKSA